jgi:hypothetical protein
MPITKIEKHTAEHILVVAYGGQVTLDEVRDGAVIVDEFRKEIGGAHVYGLTDVREMEPLAFNEILAILKEQNKGTPGTVTDPNYTMLFVGTSNMVNLYRSAMALPQNGGVQIPMFDNMDDAMLALRLMIERDAQKTQ